MASTLLADNGVSSGAAGLKSSADGTGTLALQTTTASGTATTAVLIDNAQNVGVGVTPNAWNASYKAIEMPNGTGLMAYSGGSNIPDLHLFENAYLNASSNWVYKNSGYKASRLDMNGGSFGFAQSTDATQTAGSTITFTTAMTLDSSGNLLVGQTSPNSQATGIGLYNQGTSGSPSWWNYIAGVATDATKGLSLYSTGASAYRFYVTYAGSINATSTSITAISDISLKENIRDLETGLTEVMALKPRRFDWKEETKLDQKNVAGFIAQEVEQVLPELIYDYQYNENEIKKSLKMGDILPTLVKAIQEQQALIQSLTDRLTALEGAAK